jgi:secondary thiamine-phosphate synthase enzyme
MPVKTYEIRFNTGGEVEMVNVTDKVREFTKKSKLKKGIICIHCPGATGAMTTIEYEDGLLEDFPKLLEDIAPKNAVYQHHLRWHDGNGHSHVRASLIGPSITVPFVDGEPVLGTWQQLTFVELDNKARERRLLVQIVGE